MRSLKKASEFSEVPSVEFSTKMSDILTIIEAVFFLSGYLRMYPSSAFSLLIAIMNYHQIRVWRSQSQASQGPALLVGGLTWELLLLCSVSLLAFVVPLDWQMMTAAPNLRRWMDKYQWLTVASYNLVSIVSVIILFFQMATTLVDLGRMLHAVETEPGLRRSGVHRTVVRLLLVALLPNLCFNNAIGLWASRLFPGDFCSVLPVPQTAMVFMLICLGHASTVMQITYDRITRGPYNLFYIADVVVVMGWSLACFTCIDTSHVTVLVMFVWFVVVWISGVKGLSAQETIL